jgi:hypothetical protein
MTGSGKIHGRLHGDKIYGLEKNSPSIFWGFYSSRIDCRKIHSVDNHLFTRTWSFISVKLLLPDVWESLHLPRLYLSNQVEIT